jgi:outer membrane protein TolC
MKAPSFSAALLVGLSAATHAGPTAPPAAGIQEPPRDGGAPWSEPRSADDGDEARELAGPVGSASEHIRRLEGDLRELPISLDAALTLAETNNLGLALEDVATEVARFDALGSWGEFDWVVGGTARYTDFERKPSAVVEGGQILTGNVESYSLSLSRPNEFGGRLEGAVQSDSQTSTSANQIDPTQVSSELRLAYTQPLLRGAGQDRATSEQEESELLFEQQVERRRQVLQELLRSTSDAYWDLVQARDQVEVARKSLELGMEQRERNQRLLDAGVGTEVEVIQAEAEVARREEVLLLREVELRRAGDALKQLLFPGKDTTSWNTRLEPTTGVPEEVGVEDVPRWADAFETAVAERPELRQRRLDLDLATLRHERAVNDRRYGLDLDASISSQGLETDFNDSLSEALDLEFLTWSAGVTLDAPVQNRTRAYAERAARARLRSAHLSLEQVETQVVAEVRDAVRQLHYSSMAVTAAQQSRRAAERQLEAEMARYENDLSTNFQVLEFQLALIEAVNSELVSRVNFAKARYQLLAATGTLGEAR